MLNSTYFRPTSAEQRRAKKREAQRRYRRGVRLRSNVSSDAEDPTQCENLDKANEAIPQETGSDNGENNHQSRGVVPQRDMTINDVENWDLILDMPHSQSPIFQPQPQSYAQSEQLEQITSPGKWKPSHFPSPQQMVPVLEPNKFDEGSYQNFFPDGDGGLVPVPNSQALIQPSTFSSQVNYTGMHAGVNSPISYRHTSVNQDIEPQTPPFTPISTQSRPVKRTVQSSFTNSTRNKLQTVSPGRRSSIQYSQSKNGAMSPILRENFAENHDIMAHQNNSPEARLHGNTPLFQAVVLGNMKIVAILAERSNNINAENKSGQTVLHIAVQEGHANIAAYLIRCGSNLNHRDNDGNTPLHVAVMNGHESIVQILLDAGANMEISNFEGDGIVMKDKTR